MTSGSNGGIEIASLPPIIDVLVSGRATFIPPTPARGLIDTGSSVVFIDLKLAESAGLKRHNETEVHVPGGLSFDATVFSGFLEVPELKYKERIQFYASNHKQVSHDILLGRSFLKNYLVMFNGPEGRFHFSRPFSFPGPAPDDDYAS